MTGIVLANTENVGSANATLTMSKTSATTPTLANRTGTVGFAVSNGARSDYQVEAYLFAGIMSSCNKEITSVRVQVNDTYYKEWPVPDYYALVESTVYASARGSGKTGCNASVRISEQ